MINKNKIGFVHLPRTAGTYMEGVMASVMGPERFINFFGTPDNQVANKLGIIERIAVDKQRQDCILQIPNWSTAELFSGHFSLNVEPFLPQEYNYSYITIIRDPITRVYSFVKKVTSSGGFRRHLTSNGDDPIGGDIFWERFIDYCNNNTKIGLSNHERNGFSNYMTKVFSASDLSRDDIVVDENLYNKAKENLNKMKYIGLFENYKETIDSFLKIFNVEFNRYHIRESRNKNIDNKKILDFIESINTYDTKLYKEFS